MIWNRRQEANEERLADLERRLENTREDAAKARSLQIILASITLTGGLSAPFIDHALDDPPSSTAPAQEQQLTPEEVADCVQAWSEGIRFADANPGVGAVKIEGDPCNTYDIVQRHLNQRIDVSVPPGIPAAPPRPALPASPSVPALPPGTGGQGGTG